MNTAAKKIISQLTPIQQKIFSCLCNQPVITRKNLLLYLKQQGYFAGVSLQTADRYLREEKEKMVRKGIPIGSTHGVADKSLNAGKKVAKGYFLAYSPALQEKADCEYQKKIETMSVYRHQFKKACELFGYIAPDETGQLSLFGR